MTAAETVAAPALLPASPYRGIESFRYVDQAIFFARGPETRKLVRYVCVYRGALLYGDSGSGKSSLVNAGLIPAIREEGFTPDRLRVQPRPGEEIVVERIATTLDGKPPYLPSNFADGDGGAARLVLPAAGLRERLLALPRERRPLLIFDQFEEFVTLFEDAPRGDAVRQAHEAQGAILRMITDLMRDASLPVKLLFVFREDYLAKLSKLFAIAPDLSDQYQRLTPPGPEALHSIIRGSFEKYPEHYGKRLSEDLTNKLAAALVARHEAGPLNLSEVQIACLKLWRDADPAALFERKGVQGILEDYLADSLGSLPENLRGPAVALFGRMVTPSGTRNIVSEDDLVSGIHNDEGLPAEDIKEALRLLVEKTRLVRRERRHDTYFYDIASEFLVPWISRQKDERAAAEERRRLEQSERAKRRRLIKIAAACLFVVAAVGLFAWWRIISWDDEAERLAAQTALVQEEREKAATAERARLAAEAERDKERQRADVLSSDLSQVQSQKAAADKSVSDLEGRVADLTGRLTDVTRQKDALYNQLRTIQGPPEEASALRDALNEARRREKYLESQLAECKKGGVFRK